MAVSNLTRVNEYRRTVTEAGASIVQYTGSGMRVVSANITRITPAGIGYALNGIDTTNIFKVYLVDGSTFITDWAGVQEIGDWKIRVNRYLRIRSGGVTTLKYNGIGAGSSMRVVPLNVIRLYTAGTGLDEGNNSVECFTVYLNDGSTFITDWAGKTLIDEWVNPNLA